MTENVAASDRAFWIELALDGLAPKTLGGGTSKLLWDLSVLGGIG